MIDYLRRALEEKERECAWWHEKGNELDSLIDKANRERGRGESSVHSGARNASEMEM